MNIIELKNVCKDYQVGDHVNRALKDINLEIKEQEFVVILGPSGCGKTTLLNIIGGIDNPTSGKVLINGKELDYENEKELTIHRKDNVGFIFQFFNLIDELTVFQNVNVINYDKERSMELLEYVDLKDYCNDYPKNLSGGQMQRVAIARALNRNSKILLCDEPTGALDEQNTKKIIDLIKKIHDEKGLTIIMVTHNESLINAATTVLRMLDGKIIKEEHLINE